VNVRLLESASGTTLWAEQYDRDASVDALTIQDEIGDRVVATLADDGGVLNRLFAAALRTSTRQEDDAVRLFIRFAEFVEHFTSEEHGRLRDEYQALVERQPSNATGWAHLAILYGLEVFFHFNPLPDPVARVRRAAERSAAIDSTHQGAWYALADAAFFERNAAALRSAADRTIELNPLHSRTVGAIGLLRAFAGDPAEGAALVTKAISLNPRHPGWFHLALFLDAFQRGDADGALREAALINMPHVPVDGRLFAIAAAGRFGRAGEAAAAVGELRRDYPHLLDARRAREDWAIRLWDSELLDNLVDGFEAALKAQSAVSSTGATGTGSSAETAPSTPVTSPALTNDLAIAVQLFSSRGGESADALAEGLTDDVTAGLSRFSYLRVVPRKLGGEAQPAARYVLEGQVRQAHPHVRISARLNDTLSGATLWADNFDRSADTDTFRLQDDVAPRIIATIADANGVLLRSMVATLKQRPIEEHTVSELVVRFHGYLEHFDPAEHAMIRDRLAAALRLQPGHADGWACLSSLIEHEVSQELNPQPDALKRSRECAERSIGANPVCQEGWRSMASAAFVARDATGVRVAAERAIAINPLNTPTVAVCGMFLAYSGAWDRGLEVLRHAMQPNPHYPGWLHFPFYSDHYLRREYAEALQRAKQINMPRFAKLHLCLAAVAGQLGLRDEARAAFEALSRIDASSHDDGYARRHFAFWLWKEADIDHQLEGVRKARALVAGEAGVTPPAASRTSIAVLPFADLSAEKNQDWFCDGIAEEILNALAHLPGLRVAGRTSAFSFRDRDDAAKAIGETLRVSSVLEGSVRRVGDRVRVTVQLVDPADGFQLWSERYDGELKDIFEIQDEIARSVAGRLTVSLDSGMERRLMAAQTSNIETYELYLKGRLLLHRRGASILPALDHFRRAVELDPAYAPAWAGIADAYVVCGYFGLIPGNEVRRQGLAAARHALLLDPNSADGYTALAVLQQMCENDIAGAATAFRKALTLNPTCVQARCWYAIFFQQSALGQFEEGVAEARHAKELDPLSAYTTSILSAALINAGRPDEAVEEARKAVAIDPESFLARWTLGRALFHAHQLEEAESVLERSAAMSGRHPFALVTLAKTYAAKGQSDRARALHEELVQRSGTRTVPAAELMLTADAAGDRAQALAFARRAFEDREPSFILLVRHWRDYAALRQDARFAALIRALDSPKS
jgi:TolB-like protein/Tfp pilus assembly protein PilF